MSLQMDEYKRGRAAENPRVSKNDADKLVTRDCAVQVSENEYLRAGHGECFRESKRVHPPYREVSEHGNWEESRVQVK